MTSNPAYDVLAELNDHYSKTQDPNTALKIISLVESELKYELNPHCRMKPEPEKGFFETIFGVKFSKSSTEELDMNDPFLYYRTLVKDRNERRKTHYFENLNSRFGIDATLKGNDWQRVADVDERAKEIYVSFFDSLPILARNITKLRYAYDQLLENKTICINNQASYDLNSIGNAIDGVTMSIKGMILPYLDENRRFDIEGYIDFFLSSEEDQNEQRRGCKLRLVAEMEANIVNDNTLKVLRHIADERIRQITKHGYSETHDDEHTDGSIANAAAHYASTKDDTGLWPWDPQYDKKSTKTRRDQLVTSISMLVAEVERLDRSEITKNTEGEPHE